MPPKGKVLYLAPAFLTYRLHKQIRGVQIFDLQFVRDLVEMGIDVTMPADANWRDRFNEHLRGAMPRIVYAPHLRKPIWGALYSALKLRGRWDAAFLSNPANGMIPGMNLMRRRGMFDRLVIQANKVVAQKFADRTKHWNAKYVAVSKLVKDTSPPELRENMDVYYGIANWTEFGPPATPHADDAPVNFAILGKLDNDWKGAPLALDAWARLDPQVRSRCRLHLVSHPSPPKRNDPTIIDHPWRPASEIPGLLREMDVILVPSTDNETFSQAMVQGMLAELPVICYDLHVLSEKMDAGGGIIIRDADQLAAAITRLANNPAERRAMGKVARQVAMDRYRWRSEDFVRRYLLPDAV